MRCMLPHKCVDCDAYDPHTARCDSNLVKDVWSTQVGGNHYTKMKIQPFQFSMENNLDPMQHTIIKYVCRFRDKNGIQDLEKAKQTIDLLIQHEKDKANAIQKG